MKKSMFGFALVAATVLVGTASTIQADAAKEENTKVGIGFSEYGEGTGPWTNNVNIAYYPKAFNFGNSNDLGSEFKTDVADKNVIAVFDDRQDDKKNGWTLTGQLSAMTDGAAADAKSLNGSLDLAVNALQEMKPDAKAANSDWVMPSPDSATNIVAMPAEKADKYVSVNEKISLPIDGAAINIMSAKGDQTQAVRGGVLQRVNQATLNITNAQKNTKYNGNIKWVLSETYTGN